MVLLVLFYLLFIYVSENPLSEAWLFFKDQSGNVNARLLGVDYFITNGQI